MGMDPVTASFVAPVVGSAVGGMLGNKSAKTAANAQRYAADQSAMGYTDAQPYIVGNYARGQEALNNALEQGAYSGSTYAGLNPTQRSGLDYITSFSNSMAPTPMSFINTAGGFAQNAADIYNRASAPALNNAIAYATSSPQAQGLINMAMRDSTRRLNEQTLPQINQAASRTGNTNSSRAGIAEAIAQRAYDDRMADVTANVQDRLTGQYLQQNQADLRNMASANDALKNVFGIGFGMAPKIAEMYNKAGGILQSDTQAQLNDERDRFERQRDFGLDQAMKFNAGILNNAPQSAKVDPNFFDPRMSAIGGAMQGFGFGGELGKLFQSQAPASNSGGYTPINYQVASPTYGASGGRKYGVNNNIYGF